MSVFWFCRVGGLRMSGRPVRQNFSHVVSASLITTVSACARQSSAQDVGNGPP